MMLAIQPGEFGFQETMEDFASHRCLSYRRTASDEPIGGEHLELAVKLAGRHIDASAVEVDGTGRFCTWPLQVEIKQNNSIDADTRTFGISRDFSIATE